MISCRKLFFKQIKLLWIVGDLVKNDPRRLIGRMYKSWSDHWTRRACWNVGDRQHKRRIDGEIGDIAIGRKVGREHLDDIILVNPFGMAIEMSL